MILTATNVLSFLTERGLCHPRSGDDARWLVYEYSSRNRNFAVAQPESGSGFFIKQLAVMAAESVVMMQREATVYWLAENDPDFEPLRTLLPPFVLFEGNLKVIVLGLMPGAQNLMHYQDSAGTFPRVAGQHLGQALAIIHRQTGLKMRSNPPRQAFPIEPPGIFTAHRNGPLIRWLGPGQMRLIDLVRAHPRLPDCLDRIASSWRFDSFVHGDIKFENCVVSPSNGGLLIKLVDWELADFGDPAWDVGCLLQAYIYACIRSSLAHRTIDLQHRLEGSGVQVEPMRCAIKSFWQCYCLAVGFEAVSRSTFLERAIQCASARMIQMALEVMHGQDEPPTMALSLLSASQEVMERPFEAGLLLGIDDCQI